MKVKEEEGVERFIHKIKNTIAGCREKWRKMPKVNKKERIFFYEDGWIYFRR